MNPNIFHTTCNNTSSHTLSVGSLHVCGLKRRILYPEFIDLDETLNRPFTNDEILKCIAKLKNSKSPGHDDILNEYIKLTRDAMTPVYVSLFNIILKDKDYCPIEIIKGLTDKGQFQYLTKLMGPQEGTYLYATQFHSLR